MTAILYRTVVYFFALASLVGCKDATIPATPAPMVTVVVSSRAIVAGEEFTADNCRISDWPLPYVPEGHVERLAEIEGQVALGPIPNNSVIARIEVGRLVAPIRMTRAPNTTE